MRVLAVDPGLTRCGVAVVESGFDGKARAVLVDVIRTDPGGTTPAGCRVCSTLWTSTSP